MKRYLVEWGYGADIHGGDVTKAAKLAVKNAVSHCCLCGLSECLGLDDLSKMHVSVKIACPHPERIDTAAVLSVVPVGTAELDSLVEGGMSVTGIHNPKLGEGDQIIIALAALTVSVDLP